MSKLTPLAHKARLRRWLAEPAGAALASGFSRASWRVLRRDLDALLRAMHISRDARRALPPQPLPPQTWTLAQALSALTEGSRNVQLFASLRLLQAAQPHKARLGYAHNPDSEGVRIDEGLLMGFAPREVVAVSGPVQRKAAALDAANPAFAPRVQHQAPFPERATVVQNAVGLLGPNGPLPYVWTQYAWELQGASTHLKPEERHSFVGFLNVLQRRQLGLLYRAWSDTQAVVALDATSAQGTGHPVSDRLQALAGLAPASLLNRDHIPAGFKQAFAAAFSRRVHSPGPLAGLLGRYFDVKVQVQEFAAQWMAVAPDQQSRLGRCYSQLGGPTWMGKPGQKTLVGKAGSEAMLGERVWDASTRFRVRMGPLPLRQYMDCLPGRRSYNEARDLVALYAGPEWRWEFVPVLQASAVPKGRLGQPEFRLGQSSWLGKRTLGYDADDLCLQIAPDFSGHRPSGTGEENVVSNEDDQANAIEHDHEGHDSTSSTVGDMLRAQTSQLADPRLWN